MRNRRRFWFGWISMGMAASVAVLGIAGCAETAGGGGNGGAGGDGTSCDEAVTLQAGTAIEVFLDGTVYVSFAVEADETVNVQFDFGEGLDASVALLAEVDNADSQPLNPGQILQWVIAEAGIYCIELTLNSEPSGKIEITLNPNGDSDGGSSFRFKALAEFGVPTDDTKPSANVGQSITVLGYGMTSGEMVTFPIVDDNGQASEVELQWASVSADGTEATVIVPSSAVTGYVTLPNEQELYLQIVPTLTGINNGTPGLTATIVGSGFIEGNTVVRFGSDDVLVTDGGVSEDDGLDISGNGSQILVTVPASGTLPYEVITDGGRTGRLGDLTGITSTANLGEPTDDSMPSANVEQTITLTGTGFSNETEITFEVVNITGGASVFTASPASVAADGKSMTVAVPKKARTAKVGLISGRDGVMLQIVPTLTRINGGTPGQVVTLGGSGFIEGGTTVQFGTSDSTVTDGGNETGDGIDVRDDNEELRVTVPSGGTLPYQVITAGGRTGVAADLTGCTSTATQGEPADDSLPSANTDQSITLTGTGFTRTTEINFTVIDDDGGESIASVTPASVAEDGSSMTVLVPSTAKTGPIGLLSGTEQVTLQIVPTLDTITGGSPGQLVTIEGSGFIEGGTTVRFGSDDSTVADGGNESDDGIDVQGANEKLLVTVPTNGALPYEVITPGGRTGLTDDLTGLTATAAVGTPTDSAVASANAQQTVTLTGTGFTSDTGINFEIIDDNGGTSVTTIEPSSVNQDGDSMTVIVPARAVTGQVGLVSGRNGVMLQIVPTLTAIAGGTAGQQVTIDGSGFIEGQTTVQFGDADSQVVDGGKEATDGIDVSAGNAELVTTVPSGGALPYEVITPGGRTGISADLTGLVATAVVGEPTDDQLPSANAGQTVTLTGNGFTANTRINLNVIDDGGGESVDTIEPASVSEDGTSMTVIVPSDALTGTIGLLSGTEGIMLQIVPTLTAISGGTPGQEVNLEGTGYAEGYMSVRFGDDDHIVADGGKEANDGIDVTFSNRRIVVDVPAGATLPYEVISPGGRSSGETRLNGITGTAIDGTPSDPDEASANANQVVTLTGEAFNDETRVLFPVMDVEGSPSVDTVTPVSVAEDGSSLTVSVPQRAQTGVVSLLYARTGYLLQVVPTVTDIDGGTPGQEVTIEGFGFIEGATTVQFSKLDGTDLSDQKTLVQDGGKEADDGIDVQRDNKMMVLSVPESGRLPYEVITAGGRSSVSGRFTAIVRGTDEGTPCTAIRGTATHDLPVYSANAEQTVGITGTGFNDGTRVLVPIIDEYGQEWIETVTPSEVAENGSSLTFLVPPRTNTGLVSLLDSDVSMFLQIVPTWDDTKTRIVDEGLRELFVFQGSGYIEGQSRVKFGNVETVDTGIASGDPIEVLEDNDELGIEIPDGATLPYEIITPGGSSAGPAVITGITASAIIGTPADDALPSANAGQTITITGTGFTSTDRLCVGTVDADGLWEMELLEPDAIAAGNTTMTVTLPDEVATGYVGLRGGGDQFWLQIVPTVTGLGSGGPGLAITMEGSGFIEGATLVQFGSSAVTFEDTGSSSGDGLEVSGKNDEMVVDVPQNATLPYEVITDGGSSAGPGTITGITATAVTGTPADGSFPSANAEQVITVNGQNLSVADRLVVGLVNENGTWSAEVVDPENIAIDGTYMTVEVPQQTTTGYVGLLGGGSRFWLQIVPTITRYTESSEPGDYGEYSGSGFIEGDMTAVVGGTSYADGGAGSGDGIDVTGKNAKFAITTSYDTTASIYVTTDGGTSNTFDPN